MYEANLSAAIPLFISSNENSIPSDIDCTFFAKYKAAPELRAIISWTADLSPEKASLINCKLSSGDCAEISESVPKDKPKSFGEISYSEIVLSLSSET